ncbi:molecular chaperone [Vibrio sp. 99-70-13A1]|uniref:molecular chaperone n=1 Tax=Vibrio sp. 99-70-13A1 TaxID=2607601 RepID=UPI001493992C|nr:molecular chaperone [Vibrio sp. 99-70-13A1]
MDFFRSIYIVCLCLISLPALAYKVQPMVAEMTPIGKNAQMSMRIDNTGDRPLTVELEPLSMSLDKLGNETTQPADDDLLVIPVTAVIDPGRSQSVMVRYLGEPSITQSRSYRIAVRQVKVDRGQNEAANVGLLLQFNTLLNVRPKNTKAELSVQTIESRNNQWLVEVKNDGDSYGRLTNTNWSVSDKSHSVFMKGSEIGEKVAGTLVLPKSSRVFVMESLEGFDSVPTSIEIENLD